MNAQFTKLRWVRFRFAVDSTDYRALAESGFMYYAAEAQPLLPWLIELSHSPDARTRMAAYEAAFFTRPEKAVFLSLAERALRDRAARCQAMAAQWMVERFPEEAAKHRPPSSFLLLYEDRSGTNHPPSPPIYQTKEI